MPTTTTRPLTYVALGLALVAVDFRTNLPDLLPDPLGWALVAAGALALSHRSAAALAGVAAVLSGSEAVLPYRYVYLDPATGEILNDDVGKALGVPGVQRWDDLSDARALALAVGVAAGAAALWLLARRLGDRAAGTGDGAAGRRVRLLALAVAALWALPVLALVGAGVAGDGYDPVWDGSLEYVGLAGTVALGWLAVRLVLDRDQPWALHPVPFRPSLW
ncbi:MAG TPA: hypothetical protein VFZ77_24225 [Acidimicrobiales bacterium]